MYGYYKAQIFGVRYIANNAGRGQKYREYDKNNMGQGGLL